MQLRTPKIHMANFNQENEFCCVSVQLHCALYNHHTYKSGVWDLLEIEILAQLGAKIRF